MNQIEQIAAREFPERTEVYFNTGSCGRKPDSVMRAINQGWEELNVNPTWTTFASDEHKSLARSAAAALLQVDGSRILLQNNPTQGLQFILSNLLLSAGDELVTTDKEHGSVKAISRWLFEQRGVITRQYPIDPFEGSKGFYLGLVKLLTPKTKVVLVSEIGSYTGWCPDLRILQSYLEGTGIELVVDGAHTPGQNDCRLRDKNFRYWVGSGHKWLGGPNGTGFAVVPPDAVPGLQPLLLGDQHFAKKDADLNDLTRFECQGTGDVVRWYGLAAACNLSLEVGAQAVREQQHSLARYFREQVESLRPQFRTPDLFKEKPAEATSMVVCYWTEDRLKVPNLQDALWQQYKIWIQPDFANPNPGHGLRISCHYSNHKAQVDKLLDALSNLVKT